jgi:hypothetical protein
MSDRRGWHAGRQAGQCLGDGPGGDQLSAHLRYVAHLTLPTPLGELPDELMELRRTQYLYRDRARQHGLLVGRLRRVIARSEPVDPDDGHHNHLPHPGPLADLVQVPGRGGEELGGRRLLGEGPVAASMMASTPARASAAHPL